MRTTAQLTGQWPAVGVHPSSMSTGLLVNVTLKLPLACLA